MVQGDWQHVEGDFKSVMAIVTPCRSDQSALGLSPYGHLSDGRVQMVLVHKCSVLQYLRFLAAIPKGGEPSYHHHHVPASAESCYMYASCFQAVLMVGL